MKNALKKLPQDSPDLLSGVFSKRQAVSAIASGCRHLHSSPLGNQDPFLKQTQTSITENTPPFYLWEPKTGVGELPLNASNARQTLIQQVCLATGITGKRFLREKVELVLEELTSNALYHAYRSGAGKEKYARRSEVTLAANEEVLVRFKATANGVYLGVIDRAGNLRFEDVANALQRCYGSDDQIQEKESGAGLGTYMVFDAVSHLKIHTLLGKSTEVVCWIADQRSYDPENFSFNFFDARRPK